MANFIPQEQPEITMDYVNIPNSSARSSSDDSRGTAAVPVRRLYRVVGVSFGLLFILQAALNISLRLYSSDSKTPDTEASCTNLIQETAKLKRELTDFDYYLQQGWVYFRHSFYFVSTTTKSWQDSRDDCLQRGADLVIINSKEEQNFIGKFGRVLWIGLTEREAMGIWKWVDGTPLTESYWKPGEPNDFLGNTEDCVEMEDSWNDIPCKNQNFWICEKMMSL
ncbi:CD209 antigen-like protein E [Epinephelus fuscoguttatus]|uniref:CD209 antigen-like protein E n=1 Tax=Epinephelus fuscoguttatus TaxID=293821 RepID=UPI0020D06950|nr:CD209 antigen-like protein E [Epinephelus fuscoguttatus]